VSSVSIQRAQNQDINKAQARVLDRNNMPISLNQWMQVATDQGCLKKKTKRSVWV
jgi:hypothetical protein